MKKKVVLTVLLGLGILLSLVLTFHGFENITDNIVYWIDNRYGDGTSKSIYLYNIVTTFTMIIIFTSNVILSIIKIVDVWKNKKQ